MSAPLTRIVIHSGPDEDGRYVHTRYWMADYHPGHPDGENRWAERGQVFSGRLPEGPAADAARAVYRAAERVA